MRKRILVVPRPPTFCQGAHTAAHRATKPTRRGGVPLGLLNDADNRHCFGPSRSELSSVTLTVTSMPRKELLGPVKVPQSGRTCSGDQATATRIRLRFPTILLVGSKSIQPAPGKKACIQACVAPPPVTLVSLPGPKRYPLTKRAAMPRDRVASIKRTAKSRQLPRPL